MKASEQRKRVRRFWVMSALTLLGVEAVTCVLMFWPQERGRRLVGQQRVSVEQSLGEVKLAGAKFAEATTKVERTDDMISGLGFMTEKVGVDVIIGVIMEANKTLGVELLEITPLGDPATDSELCNACRLRCRGTFGQLVQFLRALEMQGVLLESHGFAMEHGEQDGMKMKVVLKTLSASALERGVEEARKDQESGRKSKRPRRRVQR